MECCCFVQVVEHLAVVVQEHFAAEGQVRFDGVMEHFVED